MQLYHGSVEIIEHPKILDQQLFWPERPISVSPGQSFGRNKPKRRPGYRMQQKNRPRKNADQAISLFRTVCQYIIFRETQGYLSRPK